MPKHGCFGSTHTLKPIKLSGSPGWAFVELDFDLFWVLCKERVGVVDRSLSKRVPVSGARGDPLLDSMKSHQISLLPAFPDFQFSKARVGFN